MSGAAKEECSVTAPNIDSKEGLIANKSLTENQKKKLRQKRAKKKRLLQVARGRDRAGLQAHGAEESSLMTAESDRSSISNMQVCTAPQSQQPLQHFSASLGHQGARPPKRQRIDPYPTAILQTDALSAEHSELQPLPQRSTVQAGAVDLPAASSDSQCQDTAVEPCHMSGRSSVPSAAAPKSCAAAFADKLAPSGVTHSKGSDLAAHPSHTRRKGTANSSHRAEEPGSAPVTGTEESSLHDAANISLRTDMSQAAAVISSVLPGGFKGSPAGQQGPGEAANSVSKREIKRQQFVPVHGNYRRYYGYRIGQAFEEDPRLKVMEKPWFQNRKCLDVGCNEGMVTLGLVTRFGTGSMLGVDIDHVLISKACRSLREEHTRATAELARLSHTRRHVLSAAPDAESAQTSHNAERKAASAALQGLIGTRFQQGNFLELEELQRGTYDTILCLSVTKWVHLNGGDAALHALLKRICELLVPGGRLILEPQAWSSYQAAVHKPGMRERLHPLSSLYLRPEDLPHYATQQFKFSFVRQLRAPENAKGFDRPIYLFQKIG